LWRRRFDRERRYIDMHSSRLHQPGLCTGNAAKRPNDASVHGAVAPPRLRAGCQLVEVDYAAGGREDVVVNLL
jgi:hypothetical protein